MQSLSELKKIDKDPSLAIMFIAVKLLHLPLSPFSDLKVGLGLAD